MSGIQTRNIGSDTLQNDKPELAGIGPGGPQVDGDRSDVGVVVVGERRCNGGVALVIRCFLQSSDVLKVPAHNTSPPPVRFRVP